MPSRHVDFDAAMAALRPGAEAPTATILGDKVVLPASRPVALVLMARRLRDPDERRTVTFAEALDVLRIVFGPDIVDRWVATGMGEDAFYTLLLSLPGWWTLPDTGPGDTSGEASPPATGAPTSSSTTSSADGGTSSPTSTPATTATT